MSSDTTFGALARTTTTEAESEQNAAKRHRSCGRRLVVEGLTSEMRLVCRYFGNVCELDLIFNFHKAYFMLDELLLGGEQQETSKRSIQHVIQEQDALVENAKNA